MKRTIHIALFVVAIGPGCVAPPGMGSRPVPLGARVVAVVPVNAAAALPAAPTSTSTSTSNAAPVRPGLLGLVQSPDSPTAPPVVMAPEAVSTPAESYRPWARFGASVGGILTAMNSSVRVGLPGVGVSVDLEELLDLDTSTQSVRLEGFWRFTENRRHRFDVSWIDLGRSAEKTLAQDLDLGNGVVIPVGGQVGTVLDLSLIRFAYSYSIFQDERFDLALSGGFYVAPIEFDLVATGIASTESSFGVTAPLPVIGVRTDFAIAPRWYLRNDLNIFYMELGGYSGAISSSMSGVEYRPLEHVSFGLGIDTFRLAVDANSATDIPGVNQAGSVQFSYVGLAFYLKTLW